MNGASSSEFYINAVTNNSFTLANAEETIKQSIYNSFGYLNNLQKTEIDLYRGHFTSSDLHTFDTHKTRVRLVVSKDLIHASVRDKYRRGKLYQKEITLKNISDNQDVFIHMPLVFLNGFNTVNFTVKAYESYTEIYFDKTNALLSCNDIDVIFVLNDGIITTQANKYVFADTNNKLPMKLFDNPIEFNSTGLTTITNMGSDTGSSFNYATFDDNAISIDLSANAQSIISNNRRVSVSVILTRYMHTMENIITTYMDGESVKIKPFIITDDDGSAFKMPIPVENIIVTKYDSTIGDFKIDSTISIKRTYPFIYDIEDDAAVDGDKYQVIYFYYPMSVGYSYTNFLKYSYLTALQTTEYDNIVDLIIAIRKGECAKFNYLLTYTPSDYDYSIPDFDDDTDHPYHFNYKIDKLGDFIKANPYVLMDYVAGQSVANMFFEIDTSKIDLSSRIRTSNDHEAKIPEHIIFFDEPCYVFSIFMGDTEKYDKVFYIDGLFCSHKYSFREFNIEYVYLPVSAVAPTSIIEVERLDGYTYEKTLRLRSQTEPALIDINIPSRLSTRPISRDVIIQHDSNIVDKSHFSMIVDDNEISYDIKGYDYAPAKKFSLFITDSTYQGMELTISVDKSNTVYTTDCEMNNIFVTYVPETFYLKKDYIRAYVNGRIVRSEIIDVIHDLASDMYILYILKPIREDSVVVIQISPISYVRVYHMSTIPSDGLVDFAGELNKPFSPIYYDVYVNGRKLVNENILQISPTRVRFVGLKSLKNLEIYEKDRSSTEYFGDLVDFKTSYSEIKTIEEFIFDSDDFTVDEKTQLENIILYDKYGITSIPANENNESDILQDEIDIESLPIAKFTLNNIFESTAINPDIRQLDESVLDNGVEEDFAQWLESDSAAEENEKNVVRLNPDICVETAVASQTISSNTGFTQKRIIDF